jgi:polyhydroxyalkanoate synthesis regulator phasin
MKSIDKGGCMKFNHSLRLFLIASCVVLQVSAKVVLFAPNTLISKSKFELLKRDFNAMILHLSDVEHVKAAQAIIDVIAQDESKFHFASMMQCQLAVAFEQFVQTPEGAALKQMPEKVLVSSQQNVKVIDEGIKVKKQPKGLGTILELVKSSQASFGKFVGEYADRLRNQLSEKEMMIAARDEQLLSKEKKIDSLSEQVAALTAQNKLMRAQFGYNVQEQLLAQANSMFGQ